MAFVVDGRYEDSVLTSGRTLRLTQAVAEEMGLYCPPDFAWRCGDYGMYLALRHFPEVKFFWQIEYDVRIQGDASQFFSFFQSATADMLAAHYRPSDRSYRWFSFSAGRNVTPYRCLFPVIRLSSRALSFLHSKRVQHGRRRQRRATWPNDEGFVATTLSNSDYTCRDFNDFGQTFYDESTFSYFTPIPGEDFSPSHLHPTLYHPVLYGEDYRRKIIALKARPSPLKFPARVEQRLRRPFNHVATW